MVKFQRKGSNWEVIKHGEAVALIRQAEADEQSDWGNVLLEHATGRIDRHHHVADAKADAAKL